MKIALAYIGTLVALMAMDGVWIGLIAKSFYADHIGYLYRSPLIFPALIAFYLFYAAAVLYFVGIPAQGSLLKAALVGAFLGFTVYMTYDLVNYGTIKDWPFIVVLVDVAWGTVMTAVASCVAALIL